MEKMAILGTGLIGTSLGLAVKRSGARNAEIVGTDIDRGHASKALSMGAIDRIEGHLANAVDDAQIVIIATPVAVMKDVMQVIGHRLMEGCLVTDTGNCKGVVMEWAEQYLPRTVNFVGGDPMVHKDGAGPAAADGAIFQGRPYCLISGRQVQGDAMGVLTDIVSAIGAKPYFIDVAEHDSFASAVSHLPILVSLALVGCTSKSPSWSDIAQMASSRFGEVTRPTSGDSVSHKEILFGDTQSVVHWIDAYIRELYEIRQILVGDDEGKMEALEKVFSQATEARARWLTDSVRPGSRDAHTNVAMPSPFSEMFMGGAATRRLSELTESRRDKDAKKKR